MHLPYTPRAGQSQMVETIRSAQGKGRHAVVEAPTGTGKTIATLVAGLDSARQASRRLVYLTRTNSQQSQVVQEHGALVLDGQDPGLLIPFMGRRQYCPLLRDDERFRDGTSEELGRLCRDAKAKAVRSAESGEPVKGACPYYARLLRDGTGPVEALLAQGGLDAGMLAERITACGSCPYEALKALLPKAEAVVAPYIFFLDGKLRDTFLSWLGVGPDEVHLVVDEAHNLPEAARDHHSPRLSATTLVRALREAEEYQDPTLAGSLLTTSLLHSLQGAIHALAAEHVIGDEDGRLPPRALEECLMERLRTPSPILRKAAADLDTWGEVIREDRRNKGRLPRSYLGTVGSFLRFWMEMQDAPYAHLITGGDNPAVEGCLLDPATVLGWLHECASSTHISGTLAPTADHVALCGLPADTVQTVIGSPFSSDQLRVYGFDGVHRRWKEHQEDPGHAARQQDVARACLERLPGKTALFFPSHAMLRDYLEEGFLHGLDRPLYQEAPDMSTPDLVRLVDRFKADPHPGALLAGVLGGRLTEGIDYPGQALEAMLLFGIPYPRPTARLQALIQEGDRRHDGRGWTLTVHNPVGRTLRQAVGRLVRGPGDHGTVIVLDERIARFRTHITDLTMISDPDRIGGPAQTERGFTTGDRILSSRKDRT